MKVHASALRHGISAEDAVQAAEWSLWIEPLDDNGPPQRELRLASTPERGCWRPSSSSLKAATRMIIQTMPHRKKYLDLLP